MGIKEDTWKNRIAERSDLSTCVVHLTRVENNKNVKDEKLSLAILLIKILNDRKIIASTTTSGFIVGKTPAVCFQDAPLTGIAQNILYEQKYKKQNPDSKVRYNGAGVMFPKPYAFEKGARPVVYEPTTAAKKILPESEYWRIVNLELGKTDNFIDWTHEREWRHPQDFNFDIEEAIVLLPNFKQYQLFMKECKKQKLDYPERLKGVINMGAVAY
ncbi:DUF2971 domain-containing protein [Rugamonas apoptosis]|uniref:DUF2971 domain-containing protein n=1 Tax=Rugamonas apoptosis TaxID=2758570 RepID=A0A7W2FCV3_9BURK|nr:DUF2971 domain-containing protein [Rugamonas apoptosis]MBA5689395.1 DUF2971 domain-containing protein [Rugamonas apoptosis]